MSDIWSAPILLKNILLAVLRIYVRLIGLSLALHLIVRSCYGGVGGNLARQWNVRSVVLAVSIWAVPGSVLTMVQVIVHT